MLLIALSVDLPGWPAAADRRPDAGRAAGAAPSTTTVAAQDPVRSWAAAAQRLSA